MYPIGKLKVIEKDLPLDQDTTLPELRPAEGMEWILIFLYASHDNVADVSSKWRVWNKDGGNFTVISDGSLSTNAQLWFRSHDAYGMQLGMPPKFNNDYWPCFTATVAAGKRISVRGMVIERPENWDLQVVEMFANSMGYHLPIRSRE